VNGCYSTHTCEWIGGSAEALCTVSAARAGQENIGAAIKLSCTGRRGKGRTGRSVALDLDGRTGRSAALDLDRAGLSCPARPAGAGLVRGHG
jgi:hypothetical protein